MCCREETVGCRPVSGDEHSLQVLVFLPEGQLQQEDVRGVQTVRAGRRQRKQQVRKRRLNGARLVLLTVAELVFLNQDD